MTLMQTLIGSLLSKKKQTRVRLNGEGCGTTIVENVGLEKGWDALLRARPPRAWHAPGGPCGPRYLHGCRFSRVVGGGRILPGVERRRSLQSMCSLRTRDTGSSLRCPIAS